MKSFFSVVYVITALIVKVKEIIILIIKKLNIESLINRLRDYFAVNAIVNNVNPIVVTDILGVEFDMIKKYLNTAKERIDMEDEIEKLDHI